MRIFVTGASGFIGSAVVPELLAAGHQVIGLARSETSAQTLADAGVQVQRGSLDDLDSLRTGADSADGVIHLAFKHDIAFSGDFQGAADADLRAIKTFGAALAGSDRPFVIASGFSGFTPGQIVTEADMPGAAGGPRAAAAGVTLDLAAQGVRSVVVRLSPTVHGEGDPAFLATLISVAREKGISGYIGDGNNHWPAVHRLDAAHLFRLAVEQAPAGSVLHGVADEGIAIRTVAEVISQHLQVPVVSIPNEAAGEHFGWLGTFLAADIQASSVQTRELLRWQPTHPGLLEDLEQGHYFTNNN